MFRMSPSKRVQTPTKNSWLLIQSHQKNMYRNQNMEKRWKKVKVVPGNGHKVPILHTERYFLTSRNAVLPNNQCLKLMSNASQGPGLNPNIPTWNTQQFNPTKPYPQLKAATNFTRRHESGSFHAKCQGIPCSHDLRFQKFTTT